jgi:hypothetical protein
MVANNGISAVLVSTDLETRRGFYEDKVGLKLSPGTKKRQVVARPTRALPSLGAARRLSDRHSERSRGFCRRLCATATTKSRRLAGRAGGATVTRSPFVRTRRERGRCSDARSACKAQAETLPVDTLECQLTAPSPPTSPQKVPTSDS